ncbi:hypothetical protein MSP8886_03370 [Marinomonas spartinae]|uniref:Uncharacterized protein n=1 Tax=Marinomonas spartinae TaxID=1792290 RepID=A0A1A8TPU3_9GAMM|nr:hypothetical protein [Marinomonas spartinae]SBS35387.1 hypothetical protein MSP8886_03370 [Marinomonas spartinae]
MSIVKMISRKARKDPLRNPDHSTTEVKLVAERPHLSTEDLICQA